MQIPQRFAQQDGVGPEQPVEHRRMAGGLTWELTLLPGHRQGHRGELLDLWEVSPWGEVGKEPSKPMFLWPAVFC